MPLLKQKKLLKKFWQSNWPEIFFAIFAFCFSWWLMWHTFNYKDGQMLIAGKVWSDFAANIPLIRSFSWGKNWPPEYPLFPGEPIRYHFLFYFLVGMLEKIGLPISWALNLPSIFGFFGLLLIIYFLTKLLFNKRFVAFLAVIFFLFNSSLTFLEFFRQHPLSWETPKQILTNRNFPSFGPYDGKIISAFWSLNIYTNQRHLASAYFLILLMVYLIVKKIKENKKIKFWQIVFLGIIFGMMPFFHKVGFLMIVIILGFFFLFFAKIRKGIFLIGVIGLIFSLPQIFYQTKGEMSSILFYPGYLVSHPLNLNKILSYWWQNLGLSLILIPLGFLLANKLAKKIFPPFFSLFLIANLFQFSPEIAANHKFFNLFIIVGNMFSAWFIFLIWEKKFLGKIMALLLIFLMTFSGIIDFFPIKNDIIYRIDDAPKNPEVKWIKENTPPDAVFLNSSYLYHQASLAGRKIFLGWPYFPWSAGYNVDKRTQLMKKIWGSNDKEEICFLLKQNLVYGVFLENNLSDFSVDKLFWENYFSPSHKTDNLSLYLTDKNCQ
ncbi:MAG: hypothetical protein ACPLKP_03735 [Microgenomates group bacterium]